MRKIRMSNNNYAKGWLTGLFFYPLAVVAYKPDLHADLTSYAISQSVIGNSNVIWNDWGYTSRNQQLTYDHTLPAPQDVSGKWYSMPPENTIDEIAAFGSVVEDSAHQFICPVH